MTPPYPYEFSWPPHWPFAWRPSLAAWAEPRLQDEIQAGAALALAALVLCLAAWRWRRLALGLVLAAVPLAYLSASRLDLLLVPATPTSFHASPTGFTAQSVVRGQEVYTRHCQGCHGIEGRGDGPEAPRQPVPPADLAADHLWEHPIGDLYWWVSRGMTGPDGRPSMPGFADRLTEADRWAVIDYLHANAAGAELARTGRWPHDFMAPDLTLHCADGGRTALSDLRGQPAHIIVEGVDGLAEGGDLPTILVGGPPRTSGCAAEGGRGAPGPGRDPEPDPGRHRRQPVPDQPRGLAAGPLVPGGRAAPRFPGLRRRDPAQHLPDLAPGQPLPGPSLTAGP